MKKTGQRYKIDTKEQLDNFNQLIHQRLDDGKKTTVCFLDSSKSRSSEQNSVLWGLISDIEKQSGENPADIRAYIKLHFAVPLLRAENPVFCEKYDQVIKPLDYETKLKVVLMIPCTSLLSAAAMDTLIKQVIQHYEGEGYHLAVER